MTLKHINIEFIESRSEFFVRINDNKYRLPFSEYTIFRSLVENKGIYFSNEELITLGWPNKVVSSNSVPVAITNVRKLLRQHTPARVINNTKNKGYIITDERIICISQDKIQPSEISSHVRKSDIFNDKKPISSSKSGKENRLRLSLKFKSKIKFLIGYPLLILNIIFISSILYIDHTDNYKAKIITYDKYIVISDSKTTFNKKFFTSTSSAELITIPFNKLEDELKNEKYSNKNIVFYSNNGKKVIIDCIVDGELFSYSGNNLNSIASSLNRDGCKFNDN